MNNRKDWNTLKKTASTAGLASSSSNISSSLPCITSLKCKSQTMCGRNALHHIRFKQGRAGGIPVKEHVCLEDRERFTLRAYVSNSFQETQRSFNSLKVALVCTLFHHFASQPSGVNPESACAQPLDPNQADPRHTWKYTRTNLCDFNHWAIVSFYVEKYLLASMHLDFSIKFLFYADKTTNTDKHKV